MVCTIIYLGYELVRDHLHDTLLSHLPGLEVLQQGRLNFCPEKMAVLPVPDLARYKMSIPNTAWQRTELLRLVARG